MESPSELDPFEQIERTRTRSKSKQPPNPEPVDFFPEKYEDLVQIWLLQAESGLLEELKKLLEYNEQLISAVDKDERNALHLAANGGHLEVAKFLHEKNCDATSVDKYGWNALHFAACSGNENLFIYLFTQLPKVNVPNQEGNTELHYLCKTEFSEYQKIMEVIKSKNVDINIKNKDGETPLHWAARSGRVEWVKLLISSGANKEIKAKSGFPVDVSAPIEGLKNLLKVSDRSEPLKKYLPLMGMPDFSKMASMGDLSLGKNIAPYWQINKDEIKFIKKLGTGTYAKVYKAMFREEEVAVKILKTIGHDAQQLESFVQEFKVMRSVRSAYVVYLYGIILDPTICLVMQYYSKGSLFDALHEEFEMDWQLVLKLSADAAHCIHALHSIKPPIVHRDLKSLNLLVDDHWNLRVCDFGLSRFTSQGYQSTLGRLKGTYAYCAPEIYHGQQYSTCSDIYSLAIIFWEIVMRKIMLTYNRPFQEYSHLKRDVQVLIQTARGLRPTIPENCPSPLSRLIYQCWNQDKDNRPTSLQVLHYLKAVQSEQMRDEENWITNSEGLQLGTGKEHKRKSSSFSEAPSLDDERPLLGKNRSESYKKIIVHKKAGPTDSPDTRKKRVKVKKHQRKNSLANRNGSSLENEYQLLTSDTADIDADLQSLLDNLDLANLKLNSIESESECEDLEYEFEIRLFTEEKHEVEANGTSSPKERGEPKFWDQLRASLEIQTKEKLLETTISKHKSRLLGRSRTASWMDSIEKVSNSLQIPQETTTKARSTSISSSNSRSYRSWKKNMTIETSSGNHDTEFKKDWWEELKESLDFQEKSETSISSLESLEQASE